MISKTTAQHSKPACFFRSCCRRQCLHKLAQVKVPGCCQQHSAPLIYPPHPSRPETAARAGRKRAEPPCCHPDLPRGLPAGGEQTSLTEPTAAKLPSYTIKNTITVPRRPLQVLPPRVVVGSDSWLQRGAARSGNSPASAALEWALFHVLNTNLKPPCSAVQGALRYSTLPLQ